MVFSITGLMTLAVVLGCSIAIIAILADLYQKRLVIKSRTSELTSENKALLDRLDRIEERLGNIETIVLEGEKAKAYESL